MSFSEIYYAKRGAYSNPFSGQGIPYYPLGVQPSDGILLHEAGFLGKRPYWNYSRVFSPFWRLYHDLQPGHKVIFPGTGKEYVLGPEHLVLIPDHQMFHTAGSEPRAKFWLHFTCARRVDPRFPNRAYLTRVFTQITGVSPALFRRTRQRPNA